MIEFKSIPEMYEKEESGRKNNTLRKVDITPSQNKSD